MAKKPDSKIDTKTPEEGAEALAESHAPGIVDAIEKNRVILISSAIAIFGLLALFLVGKQIGTQRHLEAGQMFTKAATARSIEDLDNVIKDFADSVSAGNAYLVKADVQIDQGKSQDAISTLNEMAAEFVGHPRHAQAYYMLANIYHKSGDLEKARTNYQKVLDIQADGELSPITRIRIGDIELANGNIDKARQNYEESFTIHPGSPYFQTAEERIAQLKVGSPTEIDPPKPPEAEKKPAEAPKPATKNKKKPAAKSDKKPATKGDKKPAAKSDKKPATKGEKKEAPKAESPKE